ncbi:MAG: DNA repair protein RadA [Candidatus Aminicenantes bacterium]|nr:DNA repair protein RadA [Candidatus Aminicenantes bacterium]
MKNKSFFSCQSCGAKSPKWLGRCPACGEWNSLVEETDLEDIPLPEQAFALSEPVVYGEYQASDKPRIPVGIQEVHSVLGGGVVSGSLVLVGGEPGIGKSTLLLQMSRDFAAAGISVLYVSGEESLDQIKLRGGRLGVGGGPLYLLAETNLERILAQAEKLHPNILVVDSVQTVFSSKLSSGPGTISQVREAANQVFRFAKRNAIPAFLIGHITKEGSLAGPKSLEHIVDVVLLFEGERDHSHRVLRVLKNRFGPVSELAIFEMTAAGLEPIPDPSAFFLKERPNNEAGSVVVATIKGSRPLLIEVQSLVSPTLFSSNPRRMTVGLDHYRTSMLLAVIERKLGYTFGSEDIYLNVAGGLEVEEPAADLGIVMGVVSCLMNRPVPAGLAVFGEVGLSGEVRSVGQAVARAKEAAALGFNSLLLPEGNAAVPAGEKIDGLRLLGARTIRQAVELVF